MIEFQDLQKAFGGKPVLQGLSLRVRDAETVVIIGYSGTGKSVALKHIVGLLHPDAGDVIVDGQAVSTLDGKPVGSGKPGPVWRKLYDAYQAFKRELAGTPW